MTTAPQKPAEWTVEIERATDRDIGSFVARAEIFERGKYIAGVSCRGDFDAEGYARLMGAAPKLLTALSAACGYLLNAKIDLETGAPKRTALATIDGGLRLVREALSKATGSAQP